MRNLKNKTWRQLRLLERVFIKYGTPKKLLISSLLNKGLNPLKNNPFNAASNISRPISLQYRENFIYGDEYKKRSSKFLRFLVYIRCYRGIRHKLRLPSRGQRTHTNAKTKKKSKRFN